MGKFLLGLFLLTVGSSWSQTFTLPATKQPVYEILEWKGMGALVLSRDPSFNQQQIAISSVQGNAITEWESFINPINKELFFIAEEGGKYAYFLEYIEPKLGKISFHQVTQAGTVKTKSVELKDAIKKLGDYPIDELEVVDILCTDKALTYLFRHENKSLKKVSTIAVSMTHHNFLCYGILVAENVAGSSKVEDQVSWYLAGENAENVIYAARTHAGKDSGWKIKEFGPKGNLISEFSISGSTLPFVEHNRVGFGRRGSALLNKIEPKEKGTLVYANGSYYVTGVEVNGTSAQLVTYIWKDSKWTKTCSSPIAGYSAKKEFSAGYFQMKEGIGWYVMHTTAEGHLHGFSTETGIVNTGISKTTSNPSRMLTKEFPGDIVVSLPDKWLVYSMKKKLGTNEPLTFEYIGK